NIFNGLSAGTYTVTIKDADGYTDATSVTVNRNCFQLNISIITATCGNANGSITLSASNGTPPYQYSLDGNNFQTGATFNALAAGSYTVYAKDAANVLVDSTITLANTQGLQESVTTTQVSCNNADGGINISGTGGTAPLQYSIDGIAYQSSGIFNNLTSGKYTTYVKDANGCIVYDTVLLSVAGACGLLLPNAFTPNSDGVNDIFRVKYPFAVKAFSLVVYNRLGEKMFETTDMAKGWDGSCKGKSQPVGVYVWVAETTMVNNSLQTSKGTVTLLK
ncbi:MAG: gliding motility-associated C-terminal domain-containing protein, partial [Ginsengibacter sp.]